MIVHCIAINYTRLYIFCVQYLHYRWAFSHLSVVWKCSCHLNHQLHANSKLKESRHLVLYCSCSFIVLLYQERTVVNLSAIACRNSFMNDVWTRWSKVALKVIMPRCLHTDKRWESAAVNNIWIIEYWNLHCVWLRENCASLPTRLYISLMFF